MPTMPPVQYDSIALAGGLDLITPTLSLKPGVARDAVNYECAVTGGYSRIKGYERFDGQTSPYSASYTLLTVTFSGSVTLGDTINGESSGATAVVVAITATQVAITASTASFNVGENLRVGVTVFGVCTSNGGTSPYPQISAAYAALAADHYRAQISAPPGSGPARGVVYHGGNLYAFRDNAGATAVDVWKSGPTGWTQVSLYQEASFTAGGTATPVDGATLTQGGVTATVKRVCVQTGAWTGTASGRFVIDTPVGGNFSAGAATLTGGATVTLSGAEVGISLLPGGRFEFVTANFGGSLGVSRVYGCDGVNRAFEFDGDILAPISTGMANDAPKHIAAFKNHLFLSFNASTQFSSLGFPFAWSVILGAGEFSAGEEITNFVVLPGSQQGGALLIQTRNNTKILYGSSSGDFSLVSYNTGIGALHYSSQNMAGVYSMDDRGIIGLNATLNYGNFDQASLTSNIRPFIVDHRSKINASSVNREKSQYRIFFSDGYGLYATIVNDQYLGCMPVWFPDAAFCTWEGEDGTGNEIAFYGGESGMVYQMDVGTSFDGAAISSYITLNYNAMKGPRILKRYRKAAAEVQGGSFAQISVSYSLGYGNTEYAPQATAQYASNFSVGNWDAGYSWDSGLVWDGRTLLPSEIELQGTAENIAITFSNNSNFTDQFTINSLIVHFTPRRGMR